MTSCVEAREVSSTQSNSNGACGSAATSRASDAASAPDATRMPRNLLVRGTRVNTNLRHTKTRANEMTRYINSIVFGASPKEGTRKKNTAATMMLMIWV